MDTIPEESFRPNKEAGNKSQLPCVKSTERIVIAGSPLPGREATPQRRCRGLYDLTGADPEAPKDFLGNFVVKLDPLWGR